jgi:hypothetical protein
MILVLVTTTMEELASVLATLHQRVGAQANATTLPLSELIGATPIAPANLPPLSTPPTPARLADAPVCDRSRPQHLFVIRDEHGEILHDDC